MSNVLINFALDQSMHGLAIFCAQIALTFSQIFIKVMIFRLFFKQLYGAVYRFPCIAISFFSVASWNRQHFFLQNIPSKKGPSKFKIENKRERTRKKKEIDNKFALK